MKNIKDLLPFAFPTPALIMYKFIRISQNTYPLLKELYSLCLGIKVSIESLKEKHDTSAFGKIHVGFIAISENEEIAANYCVFPMILNYESKDLLIAQSGDTMTSPKHQKKGLFIQLANQTYALAEELGICLIFGFPNQNSFPGFKNKLNWVFHGHMQRFFIQSNAFPIYKLTSKIKFISFLYYYYVSKKLNKYKVDIDLLDFGVFNYTKSKGLIKRNRAFFEYKLKNKNNYLIEMNGFFIFFKIESCIIVGDIGKIDKKDGPRLIRTLDQLANLLLCNKIIIDVSENHWLFEILVEFIVPSKILPIGFRRLNEDISVDQIQFIGADYDTF